ncbi:MAG TPA: hypothetical protein VGM91_19805 [Conexibacter sp.]
MVLAGVDEGALDEDAVDLLRAAGGMLLDDREQVAEQFALAAGQLVVDDRGRRDLVVDAVDGQAAAADRALGVRDGSLDRSAAVGRGQSAGASVGVVAVSSRNRWPSSYRAVAAR